MQKGLESSPKGANKSIWPKESNCSSGDCALWEQPTVYQQWVCNPTNLSQWLSIYPLAILTEVWIPEQEQSERVVCTANSLQRLQLFNSQGYFLLWLPCFFPAHVTSLFSLKALCPGMSQSTEMWATVLTYMGNQMFEENWWITMCPRDP